MKAPDKIYVEVCEDGIFAFPEPPFAESVEYIRADINKQPVEGRLEMAARHVWESWNGGTMDDVRRDMEELGAVLKERKEVVPEQPAEGLEEEISSYWNRATGFQPSFAVLELTKEDLAKVARHFCELGCRRVADIYDSIEYSRQMAEEAELSGDLEEEISRTYHDGSVTDTEDIDHVAYENIARHFAEWGKNNLK